VQERFLYFLVLEQTKSDLSKINWLLSVIRLHSNSIGSLWQVFIVSHSYQTSFDFPRSDLNLDCGLRDHMITRFASQITTQRLPRLAPSRGAWFRFLLVRTCWTLFFFFFSRESLALLTSWLTFSLLMDFKGDWGEGLIETKNIDS